MPKRVKSFKLSEECIAELEERSRAEGISQAAYVERVILGNTEGNTESHTGNTAENGTPEFFRSLFEELRDQLHVKDSQIADLSASLRAAQTLHAADTVPAALESTEQKSSRWERLKAAWRG